MFYRFLMTANMRFSNRSLSKEEAEERMSEADDNRDGIVTWGEYLKDAFGVDAEEEIGPEDTGDTGLVCTVYERYVCMRNMFVKC